MWENLLVPVIPVAMKDNVDHYVSFLLFAEDAPLDMGTPGHI
jgi:hypothetical protein